jgi:hypothetical protein
MALADFDGDGDLDVVINNFNAPAALLRNNSSAPRLAVRLRGSSNTAGVGAKIQVSAPGLVSQSQEILAGGRYLSSDEPVRVFAAGHATNTLTLEVTWRDGSHTRVQDLKANNAYVVTPPPPASPGNQTAPAAQPRSVSKPPLFEDLSAKLNHRHVESPFDDFARQPLMPHRLSQLGPALAWQDFDGDGWEDLAIGTGRGGALALLRNDAKGGFRPIAARGLERSETRDLGGILALRLGEATAQTLLVRQTYEDGGDGDNISANPSNGPSLVAWNFESGTTEPVLTDGPESFGALAAADLDADGALELFVSGRCRPGRYPSPASSHLLRREQERWSKDPERSRLFENVGLVSSAVFSDLDQDGYPELILACEWSPLRIYRNQKGILAPHDPPVTGQPGVQRLSQLTGWWTSVVTCDLDEDGRPDLIAGNWGANSKYRASAQAPRRIYYGDFNQDGVLDILEAGWDERREVPERDLRALRTALPSLAAPFDTYASYATAGRRPGPGRGEGERQSVEAINLMDHGAFESWRSRL